MYLHSLTVSMVSEPVCDESAVEPPDVRLMSPELTALISEAGLIGLKGILENSGIFTTRCLAELSDDEIRITCQRVRAAGFGPGHTCTLQGLRKEAQADVESRSPAASPSEPASPASPSESASTNDHASRLHSQLSRKHLQRLQPILGQCGVQSFECLGRLSNSEFRELVNAVRAAGFDLRHVDCLRELCALSRTESCATPDMVDPTEVDQAALQMEQTKRRAPETFVGDDFDSLQRPVKQLRVTDTKNPQEASDTEIAINCPDEALVKTGVQISRATQDESAKEELQKKYAKNVAMLPHEFKQDSEDQVYMVVNSNGARVCSNRPRASRQSIADSLIHLRELKAEVVSYRDPATGRAAEARVPTPVLALLRILATCSGKDVSEQRIARMAVELMQEHAYDPVRVIASLMPVDLMNPETAVRVLGSGFCGVVFLEEKTGVAVKIVLDDNARAEYDAFCAFASASLAPQPFSCCGPRVVPGGTLYSIRMETVSHTLEGVLSRRALRGARYGLSPPGQYTSQRIGGALEAAFQRMRASGLVHGDLHMGNVALKDHETNPSIIFLDFGSSASSSAWKTPGCGDTYLRAGHEFDVFRLIGDACESFENLQDEFNATRKDCERELRELKKTSDIGSPDNSYQLHHNRQTVGLQAFLAQEGLERTELAYNAILKAVVKYACVQFDWLCEGAPCVRNRRMRQSAMRREKASKAVYFNLFWDKALVGSGG